MLITTLLLVFLVCFVSSHLIRNDLPPLDNAISSYLSGGSGIVMNIGYLCLIVAILQTSIKYYNLVSSTLLICSAVSIASVLITWKVQLITSGKEKLRWTNIHLLCAFISFIFASSGELTLSLEVQSKIGALVSIIPGIMILSIAEDYSNFRKLVIVEKLSNLIQVGWFWIFLMVK